MARIYQAGTMGEAHIRIAIVAIREEADLLVHRVSSLGLASGLLRVVNRMLLSGSIPLVSVWRMLKSALLIASVKLVG